MRDPNRLYRFYNELMKIHMENFPDWRFGQFIENFEEWARHRGGVFFIEDEELLGWMNEFVEYMTA